MIARPDLTPFHDAAALAATLAFNHVPADNLLCIVPPIRCELSALRNGGTDASRLIELAGELKELVSTPDGVAAVADVRRAVLVLGAMVTP